MSFGAVFVSPARQLPPQNKHEPPRNSEWLVFVYSNRAELPKSHIQAHFQFFLHFLYRVFEHNISVHHVLYRFAGINDGAVVASAKLFPNGFEGFIRQLFGQVHGELPCNHDVPFAGLVV